MRVLYPPARYTQDVVVWAYPGWTGSHRRIEGSGRAASPGPRVRCPSMGEDYTEVNPSVRGTERVTITEAATLLGVHPNTVRGRVKAGIYDAEKVATEHGLT